jgi:vacuolar-type H+-ATPase subunit B/Vma2
MILEYIGLAQINGSLVVLEGVPGVRYDEMAEMHLDDGSVRYGRVVLVEGDRCGAAGVRRHPRAEPRQHPHGASPAIR